MCWYSVCSGICSTQSPHSHLRLLSITETNVKHCHHLQSLLYINHMSSTISSYYKFLTCHIFSKLVTFHAFFRVGRKLIFFKDFPDFPWLLEPCYVEPTNSTFSEKPPILWPCQKLEWKHHSCWLWCTTLPTMQNSTSLSCHHQQNNIW